MVSHITWYDANMYVHTATTTKHSIKRIPTQRLPKVFIIILSSRLGSFHHLPSPRLDCPYQFCPFPSLPLSFYPFRRAAPSTFHPPSPSFSFSPPFPFLFLNTHAHTYIHTPILARDVCYDYITSRHVVSCHVISRKTYGVERNRNDNDLDLDLDLKFNSPSPRSSLSLSSLPPESLPSPARRFFFLLRSVSPSLRSFIIQYNTI